MTNRLSFREETVIFKTAQHIVYLAILDGVHVV